MLGQQRLGDFIREYWAAIGATALLLAVSFWLQVWVDWSPMVLDETAWLKKLDLHLNWAPFAIRYFQSYATLALHHRFGWPIRESFFIIQFGLALVLGPLFFRFMRCLGFNRPWSLTGLLLLFTAYPILGAHFAPTHTWDDFWSYLFIVLALTAVLEKRAVATGVYLTLGCFAREQIILFYPIIALLLWRSRHNISRSRLWTGLLVAPVSYSLFRVLCWEPVDSTRWKLIGFNLRDIGHTNDAIVSTIIAFGIMWVLAVAGLFVVRKYTNEPARRLLVWGMVTAVPLTTAAAWLCSFARETRVFFPPFVIIVPLSVLALMAAVQFTVEHRITWVWLLVGALITPAVIWGIDLSWYLFPEFEYGANAFFRRYVAGVHLGLIGLYLTGIVTVFSYRMATKIRSRGQNPDGDN